MKGRHASKTGTVRAIAVIFKTIVLGLGRFSLRLTSPSLLDCAFARADARISIPAAFAPRQNRPPWQRP
jgi:hypothetical protein